MSNPVINFIPGNVTILDIKAYKLTLIRPDGTQKQTGFKDIEYCKKPATALQRFLRTFKQEDLVRDGFESIEVRGLLTHAETKPIMTFNLYGEWTL